MLTQLKYVPGAKPGKAVKQKRERTAEEEREMRNKYEKEKRARKFQKHWMQGRSWLEYRDDGKMYCTWCVETKMSSAGSGWTSLRGQNTFVTGCTNFRVDTLQDHEKSIGHINVAKVHEAKTTPVSKTPAGKSLMMIDAKARSQLCLSQDEKCTCCHKTRSALSRLHLSL